MNGKKDYSASENQKNKALEPVLAYNKPRIRFFNSAEEQREEMYSYWASLTPIERMANLLDLIIKTYSITEEDQRNPQLPKKIRIIKK